MSKLVLIIFTLVVLATILSKHSVQSQRPLKQQNQKPWNPCTCTFHKHNSVTLKTQTFPKADGLYICSKNRNVPSKRPLKQQDQKPGELCTCIFHKNDRVTLKTQMSPKADRPYFCKKQNNDANFGSRNNIYNPSIPF